MANEYSVKIHNYISEKITEAQKAKKASEVEFYHLKIMTERSDSLTLGTLGILDHFRHFLQNRC